MANFVRQETIKKFTLKIERIYLLLPDIYRSARPFRLMSVLFVFFLGFIDKNFGAFFPQPEVKPRESQRLCYVIVTSLGFPCNLKHVVFGNGGIVVNNKMVPPLFLPTGGLIVFL